MLRGLARSFRQAPADGSSRPKSCGRAVSTRGGFSAFAPTTLRYSDGTEHRVDVVEHGASLAIVATPAPNELVLVRQYRHPVRSLLWEVPAGTAEPGESPLEGAKRELREETGYRAGRIRPIGSVWMTPGFCSEIMHFFHADELVAGEAGLRRRRTH